MIIYVSLERKYGRKKLNQYWAFSPFTELELMWACAEQELTRNPEPTKMWEWE